MQVPSDVPVMMLSNVILFPQAMLPLHIFEPRYRQMLADVLSQDRCFAVAMRRADRRRETPVQVAGLGLVRACVTRRDGTSNLILQGLARISLGRATQYRPYRRHEVRPWPQVGGAGLAVQALTSRILELVQQRLQAGLDLNAKAVGEEPNANTFTVEAFRQALQHLAQMEDAEQLADLVSATLLRDVHHRQVILETPGLEERLRHLVHFLQVQGGLEELDSPTEP